MAQAWAKAFYNSKAWQECRDGYIKSVFGLCEKCGKPGYIVHHKERLTPWNINDPDVTLNWSKLQYLCLKCHNAIDADNDPVRDDIMFTPDGQLVERIFLKNKKEHPK